MESDDSSRSDQNDQRIVYIMGRGHSGSTVLDSLLGNAPDIESVGELVGGNIHDLERTCSCGQVLRECPYWQVAKEEFSKSDLQWSPDVGAIVSHAHLKNFVKTLFASARTPWVSRLAQSQSALTSAILHAAGGKSILVDSSKEVTRAYFLLRAFPSAKVIHLVRNPEGVLASDLHRIVEHGRIKFLRVRLRARRAPAFYLALRAATWVVGNLLAELAKLLFPSRIMLLRYEDLTGQPEATLQRLSEFIGADMRSVGDAVRNKQTMPIGHIAGGNMMRMKGDFVFNPKAGSKRKLGWGYRMLARVICWPVMLLYGYNPFASMAGGNSRPVESA